MNIEYIAPGRPLDRVHPEYAGFTPDKIREISIQKLEQYLGRSEGASQEVARRIVHDEIADRYVAARAMRFDDGLRAQIAGKSEPIVRHALDQVASRVGMNVRYLHDLQGMAPAEGENPDPWAKRLAAHALNEHVAHQPNDERFLVRAVGGEIRGVMSAAYKRIDSRPTLITMLEEGSKVGAKVVGGIYTETRVSLKMVVANPIEVFPGEWMVFGLDYSNSDFGDGATEFSAFLLRLMCLNGAVSVKELRKIHIGRRYEGELGDVSDRTLRLDAAAQQSLARDQVRALLSPAATDNLVNQIRAANAKEVNPAKIEAFLKTRVGKAEAKLVSEKFASADVVELPPGQTAWRFSNALSWLARDTEDARRKMDLERIAGEAARIE